MSAHVITVKYEGTCAECGSALPAGAEARYYGRGILYGTTCHPPKNGNGHTPASPKPERNFRADIPKVAADYVQRIRNPHKRAYAITYMHYLAGNESGKEPSHPSQLSFMGARAVRHQLEPLMRPGSEYAVTPVQDPTPAPAQTRHNGRQPTPAAEPTDCPEQRVSP